jgi:hypothetical protein
MPKHGVRQKLWPSTLGLVAATICLAALIILVLGYSQPGP